MLILIIEMAYETGSGIKFQTGPDSASGLFKPC